MKAEIGIRLLTVERDRLKKMIEELEDNFNFVWGRTVCSVCEEAKQVQRFEQATCANCNLLKISDRCYYIEEFRDQAEVGGGDTYNKKEIEYLQDLFANYIRQIDEQLEKLK